MRLENSVAIVTGGGNGIGRVLSLGLAEEGANLVIADIDLDGAQKVATEIEQSGGQAIAVRVDVSDRESTFLLTQKTAEKFGGIDILVNNAAYMIDLGHEKPWEEIEVEEWDRVMQVNLRGVFLCSKMAVPFMKARGGGKIINVSSDGALWGFPGRIHYAASKAGIIGFSKTLARELAGQNINVNVIAPGFTMSERVISGDYLSPSRLRNLSVQLHDMRCIKKDMYPKDLVGTVVFLASDESEFICGQTIIVDGGFIMP